MDKMDGIDKMDKITNFWVQDTKPAFEKHCCFSTFAILKGVKEKIKGLFLKNQKCRLIYKYLFKCGKHIRKRENVVFSW